MKTADRIAAAFQLAVTHYRQGRLDDAEALCRSTLKGRTAHPSVLRMLGVIQLRKVGRRQPSNGSIAS
jgi:hypothetical protein